MAGQNTILFLFSRNDLKPKNDATTATFTFGEPPTPCEYPIQINTDSNLFEMGCNCHYIDYETNILTIDCLGDIQSTTDTCIYWADQDPGLVSFNCPCIPYKEDEYSADFTLDCSVANNNPVGSPIILGINRQSFGYISNITFAIELATSINSFGYNISFDLNIANMRIDTSSYFGYISSSTLARVYQLSVEYSYGVDSKASILYDPYNKFFKTIDDYTSSYIGTDSKSVIVYNPYNKFSNNDLTIPVGIDSKSVIVYNPYNKFSNNDLTIPVGFQSNSIIVYNPYNKFSDVDLNVPFGIQSNTFILFNQYNKLSLDDLTIPFGIQSNAYILFNQYTQMLEVDITSYIGIDSKSTIVYNPYHEFTNTDLTIPFGIQSNTFILFNQYNELSDKPITATLGIQSTTLVVFDPYHEFFTNNNDFISTGFGYAPSSVIVYDPYHEFFTNKSDFITTGFGYSPTSVIVYDPYHEFFNAGGVATSSFGFDTKNVFVFNPYNQFDPDVIRPNTYGYTVSSSMRYNDDQRVSPDDILLSTGYSSSFTMKFANTYANVGTTLPVGYESNNTVMYTPGFVASSYYGITTNIRYLTYRIPYPTFGTAIAGFGFNLNDNMQRPRYFDLSKNVCCSKKPYELMHIEMTDNDGWDVLYGNENGWGVACTASLCAQPRMSAKATIGFDSEVFDTTVYLGQVEIGFGMAARTRGLQYNSVIELGYGNFITDQNEIKIEITKPDDEMSINRTFYFGTSVKTRLGAAYALYPYNQAYGHYMTSDIRTDEALRGSFHAGFISNFRLNNTTVFYNNRSYYGQVSTVAFYEPPYYFYAGLRMECEGIITENWVEFLEDGELNNDYLFQNANGDIDQTRPNGESIEGYPYARYIKGRCY